MAVAGMVSITDASIGQTSDYQLNPFSIDTKLDEIYEIEPTNWYKALPYGFVSFDRAHYVGGAGGRVTMWLPIAPENLKVDTHYATNLVTTLYGVVEEHSENRYYDIVISGTTGFAPRYVSPKSKYSKANISNGRKSTEPAFDLGKLTGGFLGAQVGALQAVISNVVDFLGGPSNITGIKPKDSGYVAFHNLYRFLELYKRDTSGGDEGTSFITRSVHPLQFLNYKDQIKYDVVPVNFSLSRSATNPMLYNYSISMRGFNLRNVTANPSEVDPLSALGLGSVKTPIKTSSAFSFLSDKVGNASNVLSAIGSF